MRGTGLPHGFTSKILSRMYLILLFPRLSLNVSCNPLGITSHHTHLLSILNIANIRKVIVVIRLGFSRSGNINLPVDVMPQFINAISLSSIASRPAPFDQDLQNPGKRPLFSNPTCMRRDIQTHCLGNLFH